MSTDQAREDSAVKLAWLYLGGCCENWTPEHGCPDHAGIPAMPHSRARTEGLS